MLQTRVGSVGEPWVSAAEQAFIAEHLAARVQAHHKMRWLHYLALLGATLMLAGTMLMTAQTALLQFSSAAERQNVAAQTELTGFTPTPDQPDLEQIHQSINKFRVANGLSPLSRSKTLTDTAQARATDMATNDYFAHKSPSGTYFYDDLKLRQYSYVAACENLDMGTSAHSESIVNDWATSTKGHRECMLKDGSTQAGYAVTKLPGTDTATYIVVAIYAQPN